MNRDKSEREPPQSLGNATPNGYTEVSKPTKLSIVFTSCGLEIVCRHVSRPQR